MSNEPFTPEAIGFFGRIMRWRPLLPGIWCRGGPASRKRFPSIRFCRILPRCAGERLLLQRLRRRPVRALLGT